MSDPAYKHVLDVLNNLRDKLHSHEHVISTGIGCGNTKPYSIHVGLKLDKDAEETKRILRSWFPEDVEVQFELGCRPVELH